jgi:hypothetical protein
MKTLFGVTAAVAVGGVVADNVGSAVQQEFLSSPLPDWKQYSGTTSLMRGDEYEPNAVLEMLKKKQEDAMHSFRATINKDLWG